MGSDIRLTNRSYKLKDIILICILFSFAVSLFNLAGYIFAGIVAYELITNNVNRKIDNGELILIGFSFLYSVFYIYHFGITIDVIIIFLFGPWIAYAFGKKFVKSTNFKNPFLCLIVVLSLGMFIHGVLNWYAYINSEYFTYYDYYRQSVDFWQKKLANVNTTGMYYTFSAGFCIGVLFTSTKKKYKALAMIILCVCIVLTAYFANRSLLVIILALIIFNLASWLNHSGESTRRKVIVVFLAFSACFIMGIFLSSSILGIKDWIGTLKITERFLSGSGRFDVWYYFFLDVNFVKYPIGGSNIGILSPYGYLHNMWLDIYDVVGVLPFIMICAFTIYSVQQYFRFKQITKRLNKRDDFIIIRSLFIAIVLNCAVEPVLDANPYYFLIVIMFLGAIVSRCELLKSYDIKNNN